jgi:hypothetical protein
MSNFNALVETLLMEMPYVEVEQDGKTFPFDLELEKYAKDLEGFEDLLRDIFQGKEVKDKYGNVIHLTTHEDKIHFIKSLQDSKVVEMFLQKYHNTDLTHIAQDIIKAPIK